jgi:hypothetical protein
MTRTDFDCTFEPRGVVHSNDNFRFCDDSDYDAERIEAIREVWRN